MDAPRRVADRWRLWLAGGILSAGMPLINAVHCHIQSFTLPWIMTTIYLSFFLSPPLYVSYPTQSLFYDFVFGKQVVLELKKKNTQDLNLYCHISAITKKAFSDMDGRTCVFFLFS